MHIQHETEAHWYGMSGCSMVTVSRAAVSCSDRDPGVPTHHHHHPQSKHRSIHKAGRQGALSLEKQPGHPAPNPLNPGVQRQQTEYRMVLPCGDLPWEALKPCTQLVGSPTADWKLAHCLQEGGRRVTGELVPEESLGTSHCGQNNTT